jgi:hypothetical protein
LLGVINMPLPVVAAAAGARGAAALARGLKRKKAHAPPRRRRRGGLTKRDMDAITFLAHNVSKKAAENYLLRRH